MAVTLRKNVPIIALILSIGALTLVFAAALQAIPPSLLPPANDTLFGVIPHLNAILSALAIVAILVGWRFIRHGDVLKHRLSMVTAFALFGTFLVFYLYRVAHVGPQAFQGPAGLTIAYNLFLLVHVLLAVLCVPLLFYVLLLAVSRPVAAIYDTHHASVGRIAAVLWLISFAMGIAVYLLQHVIYG